ncbi:MAG: hypothetical protein SGJ19_19555 [Planctomycetia bacterium]|nr:hypothetical protein [Planctomycetia bacterium]
MKATVHKVSLQTDCHFGKRLPPQHLGFFLAEIPVAIQQSISMAFRNRSSTPGRHPQWLDRASDIRFVDHEGNGEVSLFFEAPTLGEAASEVYQQGELWPSRPDENDTGFDLLGDVLADMSADNADSDHFDATLLRRLLRFKRVFAGPYSEIDFTSRRFKQRHPARLSPLTLETAEGFLGRTPASSRVRLVGVLDMIRVSTQTFGIRLDSGEEVRGVLPEGSIDDVKQLLNRRVLLLGSAVYRASGRLLRVDAESVALGENEPALWSKMPQPGTSRLDLGKLRKLQGPRSGMAAIMGRWPGDESDDDIAVALEKLS